jgi:hypothetical protein
MSRGAYRAAFAVPAGAGAYAPEVIYTRPEQARGAFDDVSELSVLVEGTFPAGATVEVDLLRNGGDPETSADWINGASYTTGKLQTMIEIAGWEGIRIRAKSAGTAGSLPISARWQ